MSLEHIFKSADLKLNNIEKLITVDNHMILNSDIDLLNKIINRPQKMAKYLNQFYSKYCVLNKNKEIYTEKIDRIQYIKELSEKLDKYLQDNIKYSIKLRRIRPIIQTQ